MKEKHIIMIIIGIVSIIIGYIIWGGLSLYFWFIGPDFYYGEPVYGKSNIFISKNGYLLQEEGQSIERTWNKIYTYGDGGFIIVDLQSKKVCFYNIKKDRLRSKAMQNMGYEDIYIKRYDDLTNEDKKIYQALLYRKDNYNVTGQTFYNIVDSFRGINGL